jgi:hypothetical protein
VLRADVHRWHFAYAFDNVSVCAKDVNSLLHKELAASIEVIS